MTKDLSLFNVCDAEGNLVAVQIPVALWRQLEPYATNLLNVQETEFKENTQEFDLFMASWDYQYPYDPSVKCPSCNTHSTDWRADCPRLFYLSGASLGGMLIFHCAGCGATIRHKYFKKHSEIDYTAP